MVTMKRTTIMFNIAAVIVCLGVTLALVDLVKHRAQSSPPVVVTFTPTFMPTPTSKASTQSPS